MWPSLGPVYFRDQPVMCIQQCTLTQARLATGNVPATHLILPIFDKRIIFYLLRDIPPVIPLTGSDMDLLRVILQLNVWFGGYHQTLLVKVRSGFVIIQPDLTQSCIQYAGEKYDRPILQTFEFTGELLGVNMLKEICLAIMGWHIFVRCVRCDGANAIKIKMYW